MTELSRRYRYDERTEMFNRAKESPSYITDEDLNDMLDCLEWKDYTFAFIETSSGFRTIVMNNKTDNVVLLDDLDIPAWDYYMSKLTALSIDKALKEEEASRTSIDKIRNDLISKGAKSKNDNDAKRNTGSYSTHSRATERAYSVAQ